MPTKVGELHARSCARLQSSEKRNPKPCASKMESEESEGEVFADAVDVRADAATPAYGPCGA